MAPQERASGAGEDAARKIPDELRKLDRLAAPWFFDSELQRRLRNKGSSKRSTSAIPLVTGFLLVAVLGGAVGFWWFLGGMAGLQNEVESEPEKQQLAPGDSPATDSSKRSGVSTDGRSRGSQAPEPASSAPTQQTDLRDIPGEAQSPPTPDSHQTAVPVDTATKALVEPGPPSADTTGGVRSGSAVQRADSLSGIHLGEGIQLPDTSNRRIQRDQPVAPRSDTVRTVRDSLSPPP